MKRVLLFVSLAALTTACKNDDDANGSANLTGTWKVTSLTTGTPVDINGDGTASTNLIAETGCYGNTTLVFGANSTVVLNAQEFDMDQTTGEMTCTMSAPENGTYTVNGNNVVVTASGDTTPLVKSGNKLTRVETDTEFGTLTMVLTKQ